MDDTTAQITLRVQSTQTSAPCPLCATPARRIHSDYGRTLADLPWAQYRVCLQLRVRKWFCRNRACPRRIFTERLPTAAPSPGRAAPYGLPSAWSPWVWRWGKAGMRLGQQWDLAVSRNTLLRGLHRQQSPIVSHTQGAGRRRFRPAQTAHLRHDPGGSRAPAARGPAPGAHRRASSLSWLREHPGGGHRAGSVERLWRRRTARGACGHPGCGPFSSPAESPGSAGPVFSTHSQALDAVNVLVHQQPVPLPDGAMAVPVPPQDLSLPAQRAVQRQGRRQALHTQVWALHRQGWTAPAIAQHVGMSRVQSSATSRAPPLRGANVAATSGTVCSPPISRISSSAGMRGAIRPCGCSATSASVAMLGAMAWLRPMFAGCGRLKARPQGTAVRDRPCPRGRAAVPAFDAAPGDMARPPTRGEAHRG